MELYIAGGTGFLGSHLAVALQSMGHTVFVITREKEKKSSVQQINYDHLGTIKPTPEHAVINLAGANISGGRWTKKQKSLILHSRTETTQILLKAFARHSPKVWIQGSAVGFYGTSKNEIFTENSQQGNGFLASVVAQWESALDVDQLPNTRVEVIRTGVVLDHRGGMLRKLIPVFRSGFGAIFGNGMQPISWISLEDWVRAVIFLIENPNSWGIYNLTAPETMTNRELSQLLANAFRRKVYFNIPSKVLRIIFGEMAEEMLLNGQKAYPKRLLEQNFRFKHSSPDQFFTCYFQKKIKKALQHEL